MFRSTWSWVVPLVAAALAVTFVLASTPPGFTAVGDVVFGTPRGMAADAAAYALGSAASLGLLMLIVMGLLCAALDLAVRRSH